MSDSPVGVAAWILEKFGVWADVPRDPHGTPDLWQAFDKDTLLTNIMLYLVPQSFVTSTWMYRGRLIGRVWKISGGNAGQRADRHRGVSRSGVSAAAEIAGRKDLQRGALDDDDGRRPLRRAGTTGASSCRH